LVVVVVVMMMIEVKERNVRPIGGSRIPASDPEREALGLLTCRIYHDLMKLFRLLKCIK
jgi:hypothetical protein